MRIYLKLSKNNETLPFEHQHLLTGKLHHWFGQNDFHDSMSLYSFSQLLNGKRKKNGLDFPDGSTWFISSWDRELIKTLVNSIQQEPDVIYGLTVQEIVIQEDPDFTEQTRFYNASPVFIKRNLDGKTKFYYYNDAEAANLLKETLTHKMKIAGLPEDNTLTISFDKEYSRAGTKLIQYKQIKNRCSWCPLIIEGTPQTKAFAWNVGLGNSTGIGFGAIK